MVWTMEKLGKPVDDQEGFRKKKENVISGLGVEGLIELESTKREGKYGHSKGSLMASAQPACTLSGTPVGRVEVRNTHYETQLPWFLIPHSATHQWP